MLLMLQHRDVEKTTKNEAYNIMRRGSGSSRVEESIYETPYALPSHLTSFQPATAKV